METVFPLTLELLVAIGLYSLAAGIGGFLAPDRWRGMIEEFARPGFSFLAGFVVFVIGAAIVMTHNYWTDPLAVIVSLCGWAAAIEGLLLLAFPAPLLRLAGAFLANIRVWALVSMVIGGVLIVLGMTGRVIPVILV